MDSCNSSAGRLCGMLLADYGRCSRAVQSDQKGSCITVSQFYIKGGLVNPDVFIGIDVSPPRPFLNHRRSHIRWSCDPARDRLNMPPAVYSSGHESLLADDQLQGKWEKYPLHITVSRSGQNRITVHAFRPNARGTNGVCEPGRTYDSLPEAKLPEVPGANSETFGSALESGRGIYLGRDNEYHVQPSWSHVASGDKRKPFDMYIAHCN